MRARWVGLALALVLGLPLVGAGPASAWSNGEHGYDSYGTHDWILDRALGALGVRADWVCRSVALRASDDPDSVDGLDHASGTWWHVWDEWGSTFGGAPEAVRVWFGRAQARLDHGQECAASRALGIMAHLLGDVAQPMHTDGALDGEDRVHGPYEGSVDSRSGAGDDAYSFDFDGVDPASPYARALSVARQAHRFYTALVREYDAHGYDARVDAITQRQLDRAANAVADLVAALS